jgi:cell division septal protein FtsQ
LQTPTLRKITISAGAVLLISALAYILGWSSLLTVKSIEISGTQSSATITNELKAKDLNLAVGMKLARIDLRGIKSTLADMDWLAKYSVSRNWVTGKITLSIEEKTGIAKAIATDGTTLYFDLNGQLFKPVSTVQVASETRLPLVDSQNKSAENLVQVAKLLKEIPPQLTELVSKLNGISVGNSGYINMRTQIAGRNVEIIWGRADAVGQKSKVLLALIDLPENKVASKFDLSIPDAPIVS